MDLQTLRRRLAPLERPIAAHWGLLLCVGWALLLVLAQRSPLGVYSDININQPFHFKVRQILGRGPVMDPRLKILSYDDGSVDRLQRPDLTIDDWATVLSGIGAAKPRVIMIDKIFSIIFDPLKEKSQALAKLRATQTPIIVGSFAVESENKTRHALDLNDERYKLLPLLSEPTARRPDYDDFRDWFVYGPHPELKGALNGAGHILYYGDGLVSAFLQPKPETIIPHITLMAERRTLIDGHLFINGIRLPLDRDGKLVVNFLPERIIKARHKRLGTAVLAARAGEKIPEIEEGDTVLILPEMYTGSTDFKMTPLGIMPGGFVLASMANSVLTNQWLAHMPMPELQIILAVMLGVFWGAYRKSLKFWVGQVLVSLAIGGFGIYLFSFQSMAPDTVAQLAGFWGASLILFADKNQRREKEAGRIADELNEAAEMAKAFRPDEVPHWPFCEIASFHKPLSEASGDWYSFRKSLSGRFHHFIICDVTGHGVQAALIISICKTVLALYRERSDKVDSADFLPHFARVLNDMLYHHGRGHHLLTMLGITFDNEKSEAHFLSAGHPPPILLLGNDQGGVDVKHLASRSTVLGLSEVFRGQTKSQKFRAGDQIIAYTDGLPIGRHMRAFNSFIAEPPKDFADAPAALLKKIWQVEGTKTGKTLDDDVSIVWFKLKEKVASAPSPAPSPGPSELDETKQRA